MGLCPPMVLSCLDNFSNSTLNEISLHLPNLLVTTAWEFIATHFTAISDSGNVFSSNTVQHLDTPQRKIDVFRNQSPLHSIN